MFREILKKKSFLKFTLHKFWGKTTIQVNMTSYELQTNVHRSLYFE